VQLAVTLNYEYVSQLIQYNKKLNFKNTQKETRSFRKNAVHKYMRQQILNFI